MESPLVSSGPVPQGREEKHLSLLEHDMLPCCSWTQLLAWSAMMLALGIMLFISAEGHSGGNGGIVFSLLSPNNNNPTIPGYIFIETSLNVFDVLEELGPTTRNDDVTLGVMFGAQTQTLPRDSCQHFAWTTATPSSQVRVMYNVTPDVVASLTAISRSTAPASISIFPEWHSMVVLEPPTTLTLLHIPPQYDSLDDLRSLLTPEKLRTWKEFPSKTYYGMTKVSAWDIVWRTPPTRLLSYGITTQLIPQNVLCPLV